MRQVFFNLINKLAGKKKPGRAPRSLDDASQSSCPRPSDVQVLYQKNGWGLYTPKPFEIFGTGQVDTFVPREASGLTHIGCQCYYPNWSFSIFLWNGDEQQRFHCQECSAVLSKETYDEFVQVFKLLNGLQ